MLTHAQARTTREMLDLLVHPSTQKLPDARFLQASSCN
jgi:hypothetical protein